MDIAAALGISASAVSQMLSGRMTPNLKQLDVITRTLALERSECAELRDFLMRIRSGDEQGMLEIGQLDDCSALILTETIEGDTYQTFVYAYEGFLCELFTAQGSGLGAADGEALFPLTSLDFSEEDNCITAILPDTTLTFALRSGEEVPHA